MPFYPGDPNINRKGRPKKGRTISDALKKYAKKRIFEIEVIQNGKKIKKKMSNAEALAYTLWEMAIVDKNYIVAKDIENRLDGMPHQSVDMTANVEEKIVIKRIKEKEEKS